MIVLLHVRIIPLVLSLLFAAAGILFPCPKYERHEVLSDTGFGSGFRVRSQSHLDTGGNEVLGIFYPEGTSGTPSWQIAQWASGPCLWRCRIDSDGSTLTDGLTKTVRYNPAERSVALRLNAENIYNGSPAVTENWPHLLLEQSTDSSDGAGGVRPEFICNADKIIMSLDVKLNDISLTEIEGDEVRAAQLLVYVYLQGVHSDDFVWFGLQLYDSRGMMGEHFALDKSSGRMVLGLSTADTYGLINRVFRRCPLKAGGDYVHIEVDIRPYIDRLIEDGNGMGFLNGVLSAGDFYISGTNIGWEIIGSFDAEAEIKNYSVKTCYKK